MTELDAEDAKLVVLARGAMGRAEAASGAAVRDADGRTYAAATVENRDPALTTSALRAAIAAAASSGARSLEAAAVVTEGLVSDADLAILREFGPGVPLLVATPDGTLRETHTS